MTLLNHIGVLLLLFWILTIFWLFIQEMRHKFKYLRVIIESIWLFLIFEAFYWTFKIFF